MTRTFPQPDATVQILAADGAVIRLRRYGGVQPLRLFVSHGNGFAADGYAPFWEPLLRDFELILFDMRNHGHNPLSDPAHHDYAHFVEDLDRVLGAAAAESGSKPAVGLFHSMSAQTAMKHAIEIGWAWEALILFDPPNVPAAGHPAHGPMVAFEHKLAAWARGRRARFGDPDELARDYAATRAAGGWVAGAHEVMAEAVLRRDPVSGDWVLRCPPTLEAKIYIDGITLDLWPRRQDFAGPVMLIGADPERPYPMPTALSNRALAQEGGFDYAAIPGTGHLLQLENPAACREAALGFLRRRGLAR